MSKKTKTEVVSHEDFEAALKSEPVVEKAQFTPDSVALGIIKTATGFSVVRIPVDSTTLVTGPAEVLTQAENKWEANEQFKINVIKERII